MPLLCISLLALLLLPQSLSCDSKRTPSAVTNDFKAIVSIHLDKAREAIASELLNFSCQDVKLQKNCKILTDGSAIVGTLYKLTCRMKKRGPSSIADVDDLTSAVLGSVRCTCREKPTKAPNKVMTVTRPGGSRAGRRKMNKLCRGQEILSAMTECYEMLNTLAT